MKKKILYLLFAVALFATAGSLILSELLGWQPCVLCWYQRTMIYPLVIIFGVAIAKEISNLEYLVWPMLVVGGLIAIYHNLLQYNIIPQSLGPCLTGTSCTTPYYLWVNFITVPLLSLLTFIIIAALMLSYRKSNS